MFLVGGDVLGDPLRQKFDTQKTKNNPDSFSKTCRGSFILFDKLEFDGSFNCFYGISCTPII